MRLINSSDANFQVEFKKILERAGDDLNSVAPKVLELINEVRKSGDKALFAHIERFDKWEIAKPQDLVIAKKEMSVAYNELDKKTKEALHLAFDRIKAYHEKQKPKSWLDFEESGTILGQKVTPVDRAGLYVPGGKAAYPSSLLMNAIPAIVAGVDEIVVCSPTPNNEPNGLLLAAAHICGIKAIYKVGGASAIAAMAHGTESIPKVDVITGPGNIYVACAKKLVFGEVNIDMIAGPSEIAIIADESANPAFLAMDLLSQAEHDEMASSILVTTSLKVADQTQKEVTKALKTLKRKEIAKKSIASRGAVIVVNSLKEAVELINKIAPEHLEVVTQNPFELLPHIKHAGAIFLGENTPEAIGDYIAGPNHTLPTGGTARFYSPLGTEVFMKKSSIVSFSKEALKKVGGQTALIADIEGLEAHQRSVLLRLK